MNKKIFAALASATMALSATGSLAVFAEDFDTTGEVTPVIPSTPEEIPNKVLWNEDNFGALADPDNTTAVSITPAIKADDDGYVTADQLAAVTTISLQSTFNGEVKGLKYFTGLVTFNCNAKGAQIQNTSLDFSENTELQAITIVEKAGSELSNIVLPNPNEDDKYSLLTLELDGTQLADLDLSEQESLATVKVTNGALEDITLRPATKAKPQTYATLDLSNNSLEAINLKYYTINALDLSGNHIGVLDLSKTTTTDPTLDDQTFYVAADAGTINLTDYFPSVNLNDVHPTEPAKLLVDEDGEFTGELKLAGDTTTYTYGTGLTGATLSVTISRANPMYRLYNPNSGEHFYTADAEEKDALATLGWSEEGIGWVAPLKDSKDAGEPVYRLYNPNAGDHHYTLDENEKNILASIGWKYEGIGWYSAPATDEYVKVFREYNPNAKAAGAHNYTTSKAENDFLVSVGWLQEGIGWFALQ